MRVHELAKELNLTSKQLTMKLKDLGIEVKNQLANLEDDQVAKVRAAFIKPQPRGPLPRPDALSAARSQQLRQPPPPPTRTAFPSAIPRPLQATPSAPAPQTPMAKRPRPQVPSKEAAAVAARMRMGKGRRPGEGPAESVTEKLQAPQPQPPQVRAPQPQARPQQPQQQERPGRPGGAPDQQRPRTGQPYQGDRPRTGQPYQGDRPRTGQPYQGDRPRTGAPYQGERRPPRPGERPMGGERGGPGGPRGPQREGGPAGPRQFGQRPVRPGEGRGGDERGGGRPGGGPPRRGRDDRPVPAEHLVVPTIEVMKMDDNRKGAGRGGAKRGPGAKAKPGVKPRRPGLKEDSDRIAPSTLLMAQRRKSMRPRVARPAIPVAPKIFRIEGDTTVGQFAEKIGASTGDVMKSLITNHGQMLMINQLLPQDLMELLAIEFNVEINVVPESDEADVAKYMAGDEQEVLLPRPPVVTVMGHVDHGKTTLLDTVRKADVAAGEVGGITQHIGAYLVDTPHGRVCFLDTPGHEAFTAMRARGAKVTDIVVLVVAADDGIMPQTIEAINHAREAGVPIVVAINKIDLPDANLNRITNDLMRQGLVPEQHGGDTIFCQISAKKNVGIDRLLESILLQAEIMELKANPKRNAIGTIVESRNDPQRGAVATILVSRGTLRLGDNFVVGSTFGRIKAMFDDKGKPLEAAGPSTPVEILGLEEVPEAGESFLVMSEKQAREIAETRASRRRARGLEQRQHVSLESLKDMVSEGKVKELEVILKGDVQGSVEAVRQSLERIQHDEIRVRVLHAGVGAVTESDVSLADASDAIIIGFNVRPDAQALDAASHTGIQVKTYQIIYDLINDVKQAMAGMLEKKYKEITRGRADVRQVFRVSKFGNIAGSFVQSGEILRTSRARLLRDNAVVWDGKLSNLRRFKDDVRSVQAGLDCGIGLENFQDIKEGDQIEVYDLEEIKQTI